MTKRDHDRLMKSLCEKLNALIPIKDEQDRDKINELIAEMQSKFPDFCLSWNRELYIDCGCDAEKVRLCVLNSGNVQFEPSDDPTEHPGIVARYKPERKQHVTAEEIKNDIEQYDGLGIIRTQYYGELQQLRSNAGNITIDSVSYYINEPVKKQELSFYPYRTLSVDVLIDCLEQHIKDIERDMEAIKEKYKGIIDFEN